MTAIDPRSRVCAYAPDWRGLCAELLADYEQHLYRSELMARARAALAEEPPAPAEGEVAELVAWLHGQDGGIGKRAIYSRIADLLERQAAPVPVPMSERLPGPEDCDAEGRCWLLTVEDEYPQWRLHSTEGNQPGGSTMIWVPVDSSTGVMVDSFYASHWLPANALPLPQGEVE